MGSNPTQSIVPSVHVTYRKDKVQNEYTTVYLTSRPRKNTSEINLRDLYKREGRLEEWINKVKSQHQDPDKSDVLKLVENLREREKSSLWIIRYLTALLLLRKSIPKPYRHCSKTEMKDLLE
ncbi:MAG: hypothetical protein QOA57_02550 [Nitrososphaeraceae archaeon]|nr:hypothetical protein [Nitrososphaeraceae archaeon]